jgi:hypothetical protein
VLQQKSGIAAGKPIVRTARLDNRVILELQKGDEKVFSSKEPLSLPNKELFQQDTQGEYDGEHYDLMPGSKPNCAQERGRRHHPEAADYALRHE